MTRHTPFHFLSEALLTPFLPPHQGAKRKKRGSSAPFPASVHGTRVAAERRPRVRSADTGSKPGGVGAVNRPPAAYRPEDAAFSGMRQKMQRCGGWWGEKSQGLRVFDAERSVPLVSRG